MDYKTSIAVTISFHPAIIERMRLAPPNLRVGALLAALAIGWPCVGAQQANGAQALQPVAQPPAQTGAPDIAEFQQIEDKWADAVLNKDQYELELILAPSFVGIDGSGSVTDRDEQVALLLSKATAKQTIDLKVVSVRPLADAQIVNGTYILRQKKDDDIGGEKGVFTHIFQRSKGSWLCVNAQRTIVANPGAPKSKPR